MLFFIILLLLLLCIAIALIKKIKVCIVRTFSCTFQMPEHIEGILLPSTNINRRRDDDNTLKDVQEMKQLKFVIVEDADEGFPEVDNLPKKLRWLDFPYYRSSSLPERFHPSDQSRRRGIQPWELVGLCLHHSSLINCMITTVCI